MKFKKSVKITVFTTLLSAGLSAGLVQASQSDVAQKNPIDAGYSKIATSEIASRNTRYGIGVALDDSLKIYMPINVGGMMIEPSLVIISDESSLHDNEYKQNYTYDVFELSVGLFKNKRVYENTDLYYGVRLGYVEIKNESSADDVSVGYYSESESNEDGYFIVPTIGAEYYISNNFSLGLDIGLRYEKTDGKETYVSSFSSVVSVAETDDDSIITQAEIVVRYRF